MRVAAPRESCIFVPDRIDRALGDAGKARGARSAVGARALVDALRVTASLALGWPQPELPTPDV